jgi:hypothetical protein
MASPIVRGQNFGSTETVTATKLQNIVDNSTFKANDGSTQAFNVSGSTDIGTCVKDGGLQVHTTGQLQVEDLKITTGKLADSSSKTTGVTFAKMQHISTAQVLGRLSASEGDVEEVGVVIGGSGDAGLLFDNDDMLDNSDTAGGSATRGATQQSIKAYVDASSTDGFTPTAVSSGQKSVTLPNGLIMKFGTASSTSDSTEAFDFTNLGHTDFPNECLSLTTGGMVSGAVTVSSTGFTIDRFDSLGGTFTFFWQAIGR